MQNQQPVGSGRLARHAGLPCPAVGRGAPGAPGRQPRGAGSRGSGATAVAGGGGAADVDLGAVVPATQ